MRPTSLRPMVCAVAVIAAACSDQASIPPTSPTIVAGTRAQTASLVQLPFSGSITAVDQAVVVPPSLLVEGTGEGTATHLGRFNATYSAVADLATPTATGSYDFTASNGDQLFTSFAGVGADVGPGVFRFTEVLTIVGGTGRFAEARGTFTLRRIATVDFATGRSKSTGTFEGHITLR